MILLNNSLQYYNVKVGNRNNITSTTETEL